MATQTNNKLKMAEKKSILENALLDIKISKCT
jgi:hypothetical protein